MEIITTMNRFVILLFISTILLAITGCATRQAAPTVPPPKLIGDVPAEVATEYKRSTAAFNNGDLEGFLSIYADDATLAQREGFLIGKGAIRMLYAERFQVNARRDVLTIERLDVTEIAPGFALVRGIYRTSRDGAVTWRGAMTVLMRRTDGQWRIMHDHSN